MLRREPDLPSQLNQIAPNDILDGGQFGGSGHCDLLIHSPDTGELASGDISRSSLEMRSLGTPSADWMPVGVRYRRP
jgi:hypothetical protein